MIVGIAALLLLGLAYWSAQSQRVLLCALGYTICVAVGVLLSQQGIGIALSAGAIAFATTVPFYYLSLVLVDRTAWWYLAIVLGGALVFGLQLGFAFWLGIVKDFFDAAKPLPLIQ
tara:strand:+ start:132 stop:479 length:348 start_codon:yes stop_codon:yes gene_type:complete